jgi:Big-like domain-containing protein
VVVSPASDSVNVGETAQFTASCLDLHGNPVTCPATSWSSSNTAVATVDNTGLATGVSQGTVTITASIGYASGTATLTVTQPDTPPVASPDTFQAIGNVTIPVPAPGVLGNDTDSETPSGISAVPGTVTSANGGTVTIAADGSFTYLSASGFTGTDSFDYMVTDGTLADTGTVTMNVPNRVWFVDNSGAVPGDGRDSSPFAQLFSADSASTGETVFVRYGNGSAYPDGFNFDNGQSLIGQGVTSNVTAVVNGQSIVLLAAGSAPTVTFTAVGGATLRLAQNNTVQGLNVLSTAGDAISGSGFGTFTASVVDVAATGGAGVDLTNGTAAATFTTLSSSNSTGNGVRLASVGGSLSAGAGVINGADSVGFSVSGGAGTISYGGTISASGLRAVSVTGRTGGSLTLSGDINDTNGGISVQNNSGGSIAFTGASKSLTTGASNGVTLANNTGATISFGGGGLAISTTSGTGFSATGGGTVNVTGADNTVSASAGTAVRVANTTIGASGITFRSVSAANDANGIVLDNTGAVNGFQVTGSGSAGSGGTIQNMTGADGSIAGIGVYLNSARSVSLSWMQIHDASNFAIRGTGVVNFTLANSTVSGTNGTSATAGEGSISFDELTGSASVTNSNISGGISNNVRVLNTSGVLNRLTVSGTTVGANSTTDGTDGVSLLARNSAVLNVTVQNSFFTAAHANLLVVDLQNAAASDVALSGNSFNNGSTSINPGSGGVVVGSSGTAGTTSLTYSITGNSLQGALGAALTVQKGAGTGTSAGTIANNTVGVSGVTNSGSSQGTGISVIHLGGGTSTHAITNNVLRQINGTSGVLLQVGDALASGGNGTYNVTVTGNDIQEAGSTSNSGRNAITLTAGTATGDGHTICADIGGAGALANNIVNFNTASAGNDNRIRPNQRFLTTVRMPGYTGANNDNTAVANYLLGRNTASRVLASNSVSSGGGGYVNTPSGAACPQP